MGLPGLLLWNCSPDKGRVLDVLMANLIYIPEGAFWITNWMRGGVHWAMLAPKACLPATSGCRWGPSPPVYPPNL